MAILKVAVIPWAGANNMKNLNLFYQSGMRPLTKVAVVAIISCFMWPKLALANYKLAQSLGCLGCHSVDKKVLGPSLNLVAAKYSGDSTAEAQLIHKVKVGSKGVWGPMPMPSHPNINDADIATVVKWILSLNNTAAVTTQSSQVVVAAPQANNQSAPQTAELPDDPLVSGRSASPNSIKAKGKKKK